MIEINIKAVIFDMDGVITNTMPDHYEAWQTVLKRAGINLSRFDIYKREGQPALRTIEELFAEYKKPYDEQKAKEIIAEKEDIFKKQVQQRFIPDTEDWIAELKEEGFCLALVTGTARHEVEQILPQELISAFAVVITGDDVEHGKPHPEPYLMALERLSIGADEAVVIENAPFGIQSAKAAGLCCVALETSLSREHLNQADYIFDSVAEMREQIVFKKSGIIKHEKISD